MNIAGIDYSLTSPSICVHKGTEWSFENCTFHYLSHKKTCIAVIGSFLGELYEKYDSDSHRYDNLSQWSNRIIAKNEVTHCYIEGYAFNAVGRVFQIAENTGLLKYNLWKSGTPFQVFPPSEIKKFATLKGNSNKERMHQAFVEETGIDIRKTLDITNEKVWNPVSDIVDAYYITKLGFYKNNG